MCYGHLLTFLERDEKTYWFECQQFNGTTKVDAMHIVYILVFRSHPHILVKGIFFLSEKLKIQYRYYHKFW